MNAITGLLEAAVFITVASGLYFLPWIVAARRGTLNAGAVAVVDVLLGWTLLGWVVALAMACGGAVRPGRPDDWREHQDAAGGFP